MVASSGGHHVVRALVEFFWDTTNTFHFPWGEMMVTPTDFSLITGLEFTSVPLPFDGSIDVFSPEVEELLGPIAVRARAEVETTQFSARGIRRSTLAAALDDDATTREQRVRIFVLMLFSRTFSLTRVVGHFFTTFLLSVISSGSGLMTGPAWPMLTSFVR